MDKFERFKILNEGYISGYEDGWKHMAGDIMSDIKERLEMDLPGHPGAVKKKEPAAPEGTPGPGDFQTERSDDA